MLIKLKPSLNKVSRNYYPNRGLYSNIIDLIGEIETAINNLVISNKECQQLSMDDELGRCEYGRVIWYMVTDGLCAIIQGKYSENPRKSKKSYMHINNKIS